MRYIAAWLLGVPFGLIVIWYVVGHAACWSVEQWAGASPAWMSPCRKVVRLL